MVAELDRPEGCAGGDVAGRRSLDGEPRRAAVRDEGRALVVVPESPADRTPEPEVRGHAAPDRADDEAPDPGVRVPAAGAREQIHVELLLAAVGGPHEDPFEPLPAQCL